MTKEQMSQTLPCGITVSGEVYALTQLSARFQIKAREYGLSDSESLAVWVEGYNAKVKTYFNNRISEYNQDLSAGKTKLKNAPKKLGSMKLELDLQSPYTPTGEPRKDLPTGEVLGWNGKQWANGKLNVRRTGKVWLLDTETYSYTQLQNVVRFAPLPTIIEEDDLL